jgi:hypothetical protein
MKMKMKGGGIFAVTGSDLVSAMRKFMASPTFDSALHATLKNYCERKLRFEFSNNTVLEEPCRLYAYIDDKLKLYTIIETELDEVIENDNTPAEVNVLVQKIEALRVIYSVPIQGGVVYPFAYLIDSKLKNSLIFQHEDEPPQSEYYDGLLEIMNKIKAPYYLMDIKGCSKVYKELKDKKIETEKFFNQLSNNLERPAHQLGMYVSGAKSGRAILAEEQLRSSLNRRR